MDDASIIVTHRWSKSGKYTINARTFDNKTFSTVTTYRIYIDVIDIDDIGYLVDVDSDGVYDFFHNETSGNETMIKYKNGGYLIDENGDGNWDYNFNNNLIKYRDTEIEDKLPGFEMIELIIILLLVIFKKHFNIED